MMSCSVLSVLVSDMSVLVLIVSVVSCIECHVLIVSFMSYVPYSSKFLRSKTSVIQPAQLLTDNTFSDSLLLQ